MSEVRVNKISPRSGTEVTLGDSGDTFTIPSGATINNQGTATNFGATGSASWVTTVKTSTFTAVAGEGYFVNTTGGAVTVNLPAGTAGAVVAVKDYANTFDTNNCIIAQNGSDKIGGDTTNVTLSTEGIAVTLVFIDSTQGWLVTDSGLQSEAPQATYICASSPCVATVGDFKIHTFTGPGTFTVNSVGNAAGSTTVDYLVAAGGAGGGWCIGGGGGAGGVRASSGAVSGCYAAGPIAACVSALPVSVQGYSIVVGAGSAGASSAAPSSDAANGSVSTFSTITSAGGGGAGSYGRSGSAGASGGGAGGWQPYGPTPGTTGGSGNTPPVSPPQGNNGGSNPFGSYESSGGGGGGATAVGSTSVSVPGRDGIAPGGAGNTSAITNSSVTYGTGGRGLGDTTPSPAAGGANTANGGDGAGTPAGCGANGGSGIVVIRYKFQN
jgi:hypothetical protein